MTCLKKEKANTIQLSLLAPDTRLVDVGINTTPIQKA